MREHVVEFSPEALEDLRRLYDWIAEVASPAVAITYLARIEAFCRSMAHPPERGHRRDDIRPGLRIVGFERRITVAFAVAGERVTILRLFYGGRDWERLIQ